MRPRGLIDLHYGSVADKALKQRPVDAMVPKHAQREFQVSTKLSLLGPVLNLVQLCRNASVCLGKRP